MNRDRMLVDLSHVSADVMRHALRVTRSGLPRFQPLIRPVRAATTTQRADDVLANCGERRRVMVTSCPRSSTAVSVGTRKAKAEARTQCTEGRSGVRRTDGRGCERSTTTGRPRCSVVAATSTCVRSQASTMWHFGGDYLAGRGQPEGLEECRGTASRAIADRGGPGPSGQLAGEKHPPRAQRSRGRRRPGWLTSRRDLAGTPVI